MGNFIEKTILGIQNTFEDMFTSDEIADKSGLMQSLDPRVKLLSVVFLIVITNFSNSLLPIAVMLAYSVIIVALSKIPIKSYIARVSSVSIVFTGIVLVPSLFNVIKPGRPFLYLTESLYITKEGVLSALIFIARSFVSLSFVYILILSTKWVEILKALRYFKLPKIFSATLDMSLRYITLLLEVASNMLLARKSRNVGKSKGKIERRFVAFSMGNLLIRSEHLSNDTYNAMISRGYRGEYKTIDDFKISRSDIIWIIFNILFAIFFLSKGGKHWI